MARPTRTATELAGQLGIPASRVQGWFEGGFMPPPGSEDVDLLAHCRALMELTGTGRDGDVAVVKMAAQGFTCARLRTALTSLVARSEDGEVLSSDELLEYVETSEVLRPLWAWINEVTASAATQWAYEPVDEPDLPANRARQVVFPIAQIADGLEVGLRDTIDLDQFVEASVAPITDMEPSDDPEPTQADGFELSKLPQFVEKILGWLDTAPSSELTVGVQAAERFVEMVEILGVRFTGDEERWKFVGHVTPVAAFVMAPLAKFMAENYVPMAYGRKIPPRERMYVEVALGQSVESAAEQLNLVKNKEVASPE